jgi:hypothetical protein
MKRAEQWIWIRGQLSIKVWRVRSLFHVGQFCCETTLRVPRSYFYRFASFPLLYFIVLANLEELHLLETHPKSISCCYLLPSIYNLRHSLGSSSSSSFSFTPKNMYIFHKDFPRDPYEPQWRFILDPHQNCHWSGFYVYDTISQQAQGMGPDAQEPGMCHP